MYVTTCLRAIHISSFTKINTVSWNFFHFTKKLLSLPAGQNTDHSTYMHEENLQKV